MSLKEVFACDRHHSIAHAMLSVQSSQGHLSNSHRVKECLSCEKFLRVNQIPCSCLMTRKGPSRCWLAAHSSLSAAEHDAGWSDHMQLLLCPNRPKHMLVVVE